MASEPRKLITRPRWKPRWEGPFMAYAHVFARDNHWRVRHLFDYEECVQECAVIFARCCKLYGEKVDNGAWFMSLYKQALINDFNTFARKDLQQAQIGKSLGKEYSPTNVDFSHGPLKAKLNKASRELTTVLNVMATAHPQLLEMLLNVTYTSSPKLVSRRWSRLARTGKLREDLVFELRSLLE